jgi:hypothetical protein
MQTRMVLAMYVMRHPDAEAVVAVVASQSVRRSANLI